MLRKVLIVEDNEINRRVLGRILSRDYEVLEADNGEEALTVLNRKHKMISAVLLDISMPVMDGFELLTKMRQSPALSQLPVIVTTGLTDKDAEVKALSLGANDFVTKPYHPALILHCLRNTINLRENASILNAIQIDKLTGLYNREAFFDKAEALLAENEPGHFMMTCFDIDNFKMINDQYGAAEGDRILQYVGRTAKKGFAAIGGIGARISGDNFAALYPAGEEQDKRVERMRDTELTPPDTRAAIVFSVGRYKVTDLSLSASAVYDRAYLAKQSIKGQYDKHIAYFSESMREKLIREQEIIGDMDSALALGQFEVWFQPQFNHSTGALIGAEALVRWRHPERGLVPPNEFIPVFEQNGFVYELDKYVWERVCALLRKWLDAGRHPLPVSVNVSRRDVFREDFFQTLTGLVEKYQLSVELLRLEITESAFATSSGQIIAMVEKLIEYGFTVEIDDFGSGYSSLNTLKDVPATVLKLDMKFFEATGNSERGGNIIRSVVRMAKWLGMTVIAEGVETMAQADYLKSIGCDYIQGYLYARPMPTAEYEALAQGVGKEQRLLALETLANLNNNTFWNPRSMDTLIFNSFVGGACVFEHHDGAVEVLRVNDQYLRVLGSATMTVEDVLQINWGEHMDEKNRLSVREAIELSARTGESVTREYVFYRLPGCPEENYLRSTIRVLAVSGDHQLVYCTNENTTAQRKAERRERETAEQLRLIMGNINGGVTASVIQGGVPRILFANEQYYALLGFTKKQYEREVVNPHDLIHPEDRARVTTQTAAASATREPFTAMYRVVCRDKTLRWLQSSVSVTAFAEESEPVQLCVLTDITAEKSVEHSLREIDDQLRFLNETAHDLLAQPDSEIALEGVLSKLLKYFCGNRAYIFELDNARRIARNTYEVCAPGVTPEKDNLQNVTFEQCRFWRHAFDCNSYVDIADVSALDGDRAEERRILGAQGIQSLIAVPLRRDSALIGFIGIDDPKLQPSRVERLVALGDYIAVMLTRRDLNAKILSDNETLLELMNDTPGGFVRMRALPDGTIVPVYMNKGFLKLVGMTLEEAMALYRENAMAGVHPDDLPVVRDAVDRMLKQGEARSARYRLLRGDGGYVWLMIYGRASKNKAGDTSLNIYYTDLAEQSHLELQRRELLDNLPCGAGICEISEGDEIRAVYLNRRYRAYLKREAIEPDTTSVMNVIHPDDRDKLRAAMRPAFHKGGEGSCDVRIMDGQGGYIPFRVVGNAMEYSGQKNAIYVTFTPISSEERTYSEMLPVALGAVIASSPDMAFVKNRNHRYVCCNRAYAQALGLRNETEIVGKTDDDLLPPEDVKKYVDGEEALVNSGEASLRYEETLPGPDGAMRYFITEKYPLLDSAGAVIGFYGTTRDLTAARETGTQLKLLTDSIPGGLATYACTGETSDRIKIRYFNDGFCRLFGFTREEYEERAGKNPISMVYAEDLPRLTQQLARLLRDGTPMDCLYRAYVNGGGYKWINHKSVVAQRHGDMAITNAVLFDVTQQQEAMERLRISEEEHRLAVQHSGNTICRYDIATAVMRMSPEAAQSLSLPEKVENVPMSQVNAGMISSESVENYIAFFEAIRRGEKEGEMVFQHMTPEGWRWLEARFSTIYSAENSPISAVISFSDVTERLEKETVYKKWQQSLREKPVASYTLFRCNLSKDASFDTVEGSLIQVDFAPEALSFDERTANYVAQRVYEEDRERYAALLKSDTLLANYYRGKRTHTLDYREILPLGGVRWLRLNVDLVEYPNSTDVEAYLMYEDIDQSKRAELETIERAETDALTGVLNRSAFSSRVERAIRASRQDARHALLMLDIDGFKMVNDVFGHAAGDQALIDTACAMRSVLRRSDLLGRLGGDEFVVFLDNIPNDSIAIAKAKQICALVRKSFSLEVQISGSVGIAICPRDGASFEALYQKADAALYHVKGSGKNSYAFYRDDMGDEHLELRHENVRAPLRQDRLRRMLIVDDNQIDFEFLANLFKNEFIVEKAKDGNAALIRLRHYGSAISVVLLDLLMPGMDGFMVLEKMQSSAELQTIPVVVVSGDEERESSLRAIRAGASDFVQKPVDPDLLRIRVRSAISKAENERLRAQNILLEMQSNELAKYRTVMERTGMVVMEHNWLKGSWSYDPAISAWIAGVWDHRMLWRILLSDMVADVKAVKEMQELVLSVAQDHARDFATIETKLKTPSGEMHRFCVNIYKQLNEYQLANKLVLTFHDLDAPAQEQ